jgi:hypothetical protein
MKRFHVAALLALLFGPSYGQAACVTAFGNQNAGFFYGPGVSWMIGSKYTLASPAFITEVGAKISSNPSTSFRIGVYTESGSNKPGTLLVETGALAGGPTGTQTFSLAQTYLPAGDYWIAVMADAGITFDAATGGLGTYRNTSTPYDVMPASGPATWSFHSGNQPAIWVNDCISDTYSPTITSTFSSTRTVTSTRTDTPVLSPTPTATVTPSATPDPCTLAFGISAYDYGNSTSNVFYASPYTPATNVTISQLGTEAFNAVGAVRLGLYAADGPAGDPGTLLAQTSEHSGAAGVLRLSIPETALTGGSTYWLAYVGGSGRRIAGNTAVGSYRFASFTYGALPASAPGTLSSGSGTFVLNAWACPASGSPTETYTLSPTRTPSPSPTATPSATISATATATPGCSLLGDVSDGPGTDSTTYRVQAVPLTLAYDAHISNVQVRISGTAAGNLIGAVYLNAGGAPGALLAVSAPVPAALGVNTLPLSADLLAGTVWLGVWRSDGSADIVFHSSGPGHVNSTSVPSGVLPPFFDAYIGGGLALAIGADTCPAGPFTPTRTITPSATPTPSPTYTPADNACYVFGQNTHTAYNAAGASFYASKYTLGSPQTIDGLAGLAFGFSGGGSIRLGLYSDNAGAPDQLQAQTGPIAVPFDAGNQLHLYSAPVAPVALPAGDYWLGIVESNTAFGYTPGGTFKYWAQAGALPATAPAATSGPAYQVSVWALYCAFTPTPSAQRPSAKGVAA